MPGACGTTEQQEQKTRPKAEEKHPSSCGGGQSCG